MERRGSGGDHEPFSGDKDPLSTGDAPSGLAGGGGPCGAARKPSQGLPEPVRGQGIDAEPGLARGGATLLLPAVRGSQGVAPHAFSTVEDHANFGSGVRARGGSAQPSSGRAGAERPGIAMKFRGAIHVGRALPSWQATLRGRGRATWLVEPLCGVGARDGAPGARRSWHGRPLSRPLCGHFAAGAPRPCTGV